MMQYRLYLPLSFFSSSSWALSYDFDVWTASTWSLIVPLLFDLMPYVSCYHTPKSLWRILMLETLTPLFSIPSICMPHQGMYEVSPMSSHFFLSEIINKSIEVNELVSLKQKKILNEIWPRQIQCPTSHSYTTLWNYLCRLLIIWATTKDSDWFSCRSLLISF